MAKVRAVALQYPDHPMNLVDSTTRAGRVGLIGLRSRKLGCRIGSLSEARMALDTFPRASRFRVGHGWMMTILGCTRSQASPLYPKPLYPNPLTLNP